MEQVAEQVRLRVLDEIRRQKTTQRAVAELLGWTPSRLGKVLTGTTDLAVNDMAALCRALRLSLVEAVRDPGMEFCADMRPSEMRLIERVRQVPGSVDALLLLLDARSHTRPQTRHAAPIRKASPGPRPR